MEEASEQWRGRDKADADMHHLSENRRKIQHILYVPFQYICNPGSTKFDSNVFAFMHLWGKFHSMAVEGPWSHAERGTVMLLYLHQQAISWAKRNVEQGDTL